MEAPNLPSFFKSPRAKRFKYRPFYYDKEQEEKDLRRKQYAKKEGNDPSEVSGKEYHSDFQGQWGNAKSVNRIKTSSNQRLIFIIVGLLALCWWFYRDLL